MLDIEFTTNRAIEAIDVTELVGRRLDGDGWAWLSCPHSTAALILCESDPEMLSDIERVAAGLVAPFEPLAHRKNNNPNSQAHLVSSIVGTQLVLPIMDGVLRLGTYQRVIFVELDGPRSRRLQLARLTHA